MPTPPDRVPIRAPRHFVNTHLGPSTQGPQAQLLFDSGAETSVIDATTFDQALAANAVTALPSSGIKISHAGGGALSSQGTHLITITLSDGHTFDAPMVKVSNFPTPGIIGKNIIQALGLTVDPITNNLIRNVTEPIKGSTIASTIMAIDAHSLPQIMHPALSPDTPPDQQPTPEASPTIIKGPIMDVYEEPLVSDPNKLYTFHPTENYHISALSANQIQLQAFEPSGRPFTGKQTFLLNVAPAGGNIAVTTNKHGRCHMYITNNSLTTQSVPVHCLTAIGCTLDDYYKDKNIVPITDPEPMTPAQIAAINHKVASRPKPSPEVQELIHKAVSQAPREAQSRLKSILTQHHAALAAHKLDLGCTKVAKHTIELSNPSPVYTKQFTIPEAHREFLIQNLKQWIAAGIIKKTVSKFNSPIFVVPKKDGSLRVVLDYRKLNANTLPDRYSIKSMEACLADVGRKQSQWFSTLDLTSAFWQMALQENCQDFTAFTIPGFGQFCWTRGAMGLTGCPASFARIMDMIMHGLDNVICYIDDVLIHSTTMQEHMDHLNDALSRLATNGLKVNLAKCELIRQSVTYLGLTISNKGLQPGAHKTNHIRDCPPPATIKQLQAFIGLTNYFRGFIKDFSLKAGPLYDLVNINSKWSGGPLPEAAMQAFLHIRKEITSLPRLGLPGPTGELHLYVDAALGDDTAPGGLGAALFQVQGPNKVMVPLGFASRRLQNSEHNYPIFNLEMQAAVFGIEAFDHILRGRRFHIYTDHKPLQTMTKLQHKTLNRLQELIGRHKCVINHIPGKQNIVADYLSRFAHLTPATGQAAAISTTLEPIFTSAVKSYMSTIASLEAIYTPEELASEQAKCPYTGPLIEALAEGKIPRSPHNKTILMHKGLLCIKDKDQPDSTAVILAPKAVRHKYMALAHKSVGHGGLEKTIHRIKPFAFWPDMYADLKAFLPTCGPCTLKKRDPHLRHNMPIRPLPQEERPNARVHLDLYGPLLNHLNQKRFVLVITDAFSKYTKLVIIPNKTEQTVASHFITHWCHVFGYPLAIVTDQGKEFTNSLLAAILKEAQVKHFTTTPYHPQSNAQAEVFNRTMTRYLRAALIEQGRECTDWEPLISMLQFQYNTSLHRAIKSTPFNVLFGFDPHVPGFEEAPGDILTSLRYTNVTKPIIPPETRWSQAQEANEHQRALTNKPTAPTNFPDFQPGDRVIVDNNRADPDSANPKLRPQGIKAKIIAKGAIEHNYLVKLASARKATLLHASQIRLDTAPEEAKHDPSFKASITKTVPLSHRVTRSMSRAPASLHLAAIKVRPLNMPQPGQPMNKSELISMFQAYAAHNLCPQFDILSHGKLTRRPRAIMPQAQQAQAAVIPEPIPDANIDLSLELGDDTTENSEELPDYETPSPEPDQQAPSPPSEQQQAAFWNWLQATAGTSSPMRNSPFNTGTSTQYRAPPAQPPARRHIIQPPRMQSGYFRPQRPQHIASPPAHNPPTPQAASTPMQTRLHTPQSPRPRAPQPQTPRPSPPPPRNPATRTRAPHQPTLPAGRGQGPPPTSSIRFGTHYQVLRPSAPPQEPPSSPMDTSEPRTPAQHPASHAWMGTPEGKEYLDLSTKSAPFHAGFANILNDRQASFNSLYHAASTAMELPVLPHHVQEMRAHRASLREALAREQSRESTKCDALRGYLRTHVNKHNALLQSQHLQKLENLKQQAQTKTKKQ